MQNDVTQISTRGSDAVEILIEDHRTIKSLLEQLANGGDGTARKTTFEQLKGLLTVHNATEENLLYPALAQVAGKKTESQKLYHETAEADMLVFELDTMLKTGDTGGFDAKMKKLQAAILEHIDDEEEKAFPHLQDKSEPDESRLLTDSVREFRSSFRFQGMGRSGMETGEINT
jgi:hemerythrin superfamily protein